MKSRCPGNPFLLRTPDVLERNISSCWETSAAVRACTDWKHSEARTKLSLQVWVPTLLQLTQQENQSSATGSTRTPMLRQNPVNVSIYLGAAASPCAMSHHGQSTRLSSNIKTCGRLLAAKLNREFPTSLTPNQEEIQSAILVTEG